MTAAAVVAGYARTLAVPAAALAAPLALLALTIAAGWLSADGLVLWAPAAGVCGVALALAHRPMAAVRTGAGARAGC